MTFCVYIIIDADYGDPPLALSTNYSALPNNLPNRSDSNWTVVTTVGTNASPSSVTQIVGTEIEFEKKIGSGSFGEVWKGKW